MVAGAPALCEGGMLMSVEGAKVPGGSASPTGEPRPADHLNAELLQLLKRLNSPSAAPQGTSTLRVLFRGAGFWTAITTAVLSLVTAVLVQTYQARQAQYQLAERRASERLQAQFRMMSTFGQRFPLGLNLAYRMVDLSVWLTANASERETAKYDGQTWDEQFRAWESLKDRYLERDNALAMCAEIAATFDDPKTIAMASGLRNTLQELLDIPDKNVANAGNIAELQRRVLDTHLDADARYIALLEQMGAELRGGGAAED